MKSPFFEFVSTTNHAFMFHRSPDAGGDIVRYDIFHSNMNHVATVRLFHEDDGIGCELIKPDGEHIMPIDSGSVVRVNDGELVTVWKAGFNFIADEARKKLKLKVA